MPRSPGSDTEQSNAFAFPSAALIGLAAERFPTGLGISSPDGTVTGYHRVMETVTSEWGYRRVVAEDTPEFRTSTEGPECRLLIGPGIVRFYRIDRARQQRTRSRDSGRDAVSTRERVMDDALRSARQGWRPGTVAPWGMPVDPDDEPESGGSVVITRWTAKSQRNLVQAILSLDLHPLVSGVRPPAMVTLTMPGGWAIGPVELTGRRPAAPWLLVAPDASAAFAIFNRWRSAYAKRYGKLRAIWKREFQRRGAPHWHLWLVPPATDSAGRFVSPVDYREWVSSSWVKACRTADVLGPAAAAKHLSAGTGVDYARAATMRDPARLAAYFLKETVADKEKSKAYQNRSPREWDGQSVGRYWGILGLDRNVADVGLGAEWAHHVFRVMRRVRASHHSYRPDGGGGWETVPPLRRVRVMRGWNAAGEPRYRWVTRRAVSPPGAGWVAVVNGAAFAEALAEVATRLNGGAPRFEAALFHVGAWDRIAGRLPSVVVPDVLADAAAEAVSGAREGV